MQITIDIDDINNQTKYSKNEESMVDGPINDGPINDGPINDEYVVMRTQKLPWSYGNKCKNTQNSFQSLENEEDSENSGKVIKKITLKIDLFLIIKFQRLILAKNERIE